jgi:hypothetical protein
MTDDIDLKIIAILLFGTYSLAGLLTEGFILWLFPFTGLGGLICWPTSVVLSLIFAFVLLRIHKKINRIRSTVICFVAFLSIQFSAQLLLTPQDYGGEPIGQISEAISAYRQFDQIDFNDFSELNQYERVAYIFKNKNSLPDNYLILSIDSVNDQHLLPGDPHYYARSKTYMIENRNGTKIWNTDELGIIENDSSTVVIERLADGDSIVHRTMTNFLRGGFGDFRNDNVSLFIREDDLELKSGMQKVFYNALELGKKASR